MSSKRRIRRRSCKGKIRHSEIKPAQVHAKALGWPNFPYKCQFCGGYHVGRASRKRIQARIASERHKKKIGLLPKWVLKGG